MLQSVGRKILGLDFLTFLSLYINLSIFWRLWVYFGKREEENNPVIKSWYLYNSQNIASQ